jgi:hypothetical protein
MQHAAWNMMMSYPQITCCCASHVASHLADCASCFGLIGEIKNEKLDRDNQQAYEKPVNVPESTIRHATSNIQHAKCAAQRYAEHITCDGRRAASCCAFRQGKARQGKARQGKARQGKAAQRKARQGYAEAQHRHMHTSSLRLHSPSAFP